MARVNGSTEEVIQKVRKTSLAILEAICEKHESIEDLSEGMRIEDLEKVYNDKEETTPENLYRMHIKTGKRKVDCLINVELEEKNNDDNDDKHIQISYKR